MWFVSNIAYYKILNQLNNGVFILKSDYGLFIKYHFFNGKVTNNNGNIYFYLFTVSNNHLYFQKSLQKVIFYYLLFTDCHYLYWCKFLTVIFFN